MADSDKQGALSGVKQAWANPKARKGILITGAVVGVVLTVSFVSLKGGKSQQSVPENAKLMAPPPVRPDVTAKVTPQYQSMVNERDKQRADAAANTPLDMALPKVAGLTEVKPPEPAPQPLVHQPLQQQAQQAPAYNPAVAAAQSQAQLDQQVRGSPAYNVTGTFLNSVAQRMNSGANSQLAIVRPPQSKEAGGGQAGAGAGTGQGATGIGGQPGVKTPAKVLIRGGEAVFATLDTAINSDYSGPVAATIRQGPHKDAKLIGQKTLEYDAVVLKFQSLSLPTGGPAIPIQAYAINLGDVSKFGTTGLQGDIDYHAFQRYFLPALASFTQTYGYAASIPSSSTTMNGSSTTLQTNNLSSKDRLIVAAGGAMAPILNDLSKMASRPITVRLDANTEIGILFAQDVTDKTQQLALENAANGMVTPVQVDQGMAVGMQPQQPQTQRPMVGGPVYQQPGFSPTSGYSMGRSVNTNPTAPYPVPPGTLYTQPVR